MNCKYKDVCKNTNAFGGCLSYNSEGCLEYQDDLKRVDELISEGHSRHCACRLIWGDGECECDYKPRDIHELINCIKELD